MEDIRFKEGQEVSALYWQDGECVVVGRFRVDKISVIMEGGPMSSVPWFVVWSDGKVVNKHNAAFVWSVTL